MNKETYNYLIDLLEKSEKKLEKLEKKLEKKPVKTLKCIACGDFVPSNRAEILKDRYGNKTVFCPICYEKIIGNETEICEVCGREFPAIEKKEIRVFEDVGEGRKGVACPGCFDYLENK